MEVKRFYYVVKDSKGDEYLVPLLTLGELLLLSGLSVEDIEKRKSKEEVLRSKKL